MEEDEAEEAGSIYVKSGVQGFRYSGMSIESPNDRRSSISDILNSQTQDRRGQKRVLGAQQSLDQITEEQTEQFGDRPPTLAEQLQMQA